MIRIKIGHLTLSADLFQSGDVIITLRTEDGTPVAAANSKTLIAAIEALEKTAE
ncbi:hypothetical protein CVH13_00280 [Dehalococcoides mccartyi]|uniref:Uncharacterized protein n=1 Tax=Dehalococcoides mccartyi TaxID=61435 RepID=A0A2J1DZZ5_9CHLR|nr:hypothetical protein DCWBC2_0892 [Dehalococcoides mccartyi]PKH47731.1 hypothetical protein CVH13_00280 [Dehalococcoides mccartyi]